MNSHIRTGPDKLLDLVTEKEEVSLTAAAAELKVARSMVENWCEILEERGLIVINTTLTETYLTHPEVDKFKSGLLHKFSRHLKAIGVRSHKLEECVLRKKEMEIEAKLASINGKLAELKKFEQVKLEAKQAMANLLKKEKQFERDKSTIAKREMELEKKKISLMTQQEKLAYAESLVKVQEDAIKQKEKQFDAEENFLMREKDSLARGLKKLDAERMAFAKDKEILSVKIRKFSNMLGELKVHKETLIQRESELYEQARRHEQEIKSSMSKVAAAPDNA